MSDRFFPNNLPPFTAGAETTLEDEEEEATSSQTPTQHSLTSLLSLPYQTLTSKLQATALHFKQSVLHKNFHFFSLGFIPFVFFNFGYAQVCNFNVGAVMGRCVFAHKVLVLCFLILLRPNWIALFAFIYYLKELMKTTCHMSLSCF